MLPCFSPKKAYTFFFPLFLSTMETEIETKVEVDEIDEVSSQVDNLSFDDFYFARTRGRSCQRCTLW